MGHGTVEANRPAWGKVIFGRIGKYPCDIEYGTRPKYSAIKGRSRIPRISTKGGSVCIRQSLKCCALRAADDVLRLYRFLVKPAGMKLPPDVFE